MKLKTKRDDYSDLVNFMSGDRQIENASNICRTSINKYRNEERCTSWNTFFEHQDITKKLSEEDLGLRELDSRPAPEIVSDSTERIILQLNRSMQHLTANIYDPEPIPKRHDDFIRFQNYVILNSRLREEDIILFSSTSLIFLNSLSSNLYKQTMSTLYNQYDKTTDRAQITIPQLEKKLSNDYPCVHATLFNTGLENEKKILSELRNIAGHSDLSLKMDYMALGNPRIWISGELIELYPLLNKLSTTYLQKATNVYNQLAKTTSEKREEIENLAKVHQYT